tara:strand:- start:201 stop:665 length:465 start_codon:yes stop_codon:yes gene_type:complete
MSLTNLFKFAAVSQVIDDSEGAAAQTDINSDSVDMNTFDAVSFCVVMGVIDATAATLFKLQASSDDGVADGWSDLEATGITIADDDDEQMILVDFNKPKKRYIRIVVTRATADATVNVGLAFRYRADFQSVTHETAKLLAHEVHNSPGEGTAGT